MTLGKSCSFFMLFWGLRLAMLVGATFRSSQVCSALRPDGLGLRLRRTASHR